MEEADQPQWSPTSVSLLRWKGTDGGHAVAVSNRDPAGDLRRTRTMDHDNACIGGDGMPQSIMVGSVQPHVNEPARALAMDWLAGAPHEAERVGSDHVLPLNGDRMRSINCLVEEASEVGTGLHDCQSAPVDPPAAACKHGGEMLYWSVYRRFGTR